MSSTKNTKKSKTVDEMMPIPEPKEAPTNLTTSGHVEDHPDWKQFIEIVKMTGTLTKEVEELDMDEKAQLDVGFHQWLKAGKIKPTMPELSKGIVEYPIDIWIGKNRAKVWFWFDTNLSVRKGVKRGVEEKGGRIVKYLEEFTVDKMQDLIKQREELCPVEQPRHQYIMINTHPHLIDETDLLKPFDEVFAMIRSGRSSA